MGRVGCPGGPVEVCAGPVSRLRGTMRFTDSVPYRRSLQKSTALRRNCAASPGSDVVTMAGMYRALPSSVGFGSWLR